MKLSKLLLYSFICFCIVAKAQETPDFIMPLYFEDGIGNKDTLMIGYDRDIPNSINLKPQFGELAITSPFDSTFEVRATIKFSSPNKGPQSKIIIGKFGGDCYPHFGSATIHILAQVKNLPIKITWAKRYLTQGANLGCRANTLFFDNPAWLLIPDIYDALPISMNDKDSIVLSFDVSLEDRGGIGYGILPEEVEGMGIQNVYLLHVYFRSGFVSDVEDVLTEELRIYPNPSTTEVFIDLPKEEQLQELVLLDMEGRVHPVKYEEEYGKITMALTDLSAGIYIVKVLTKQQRFYTYKLLKM